MHLLFYVSYPAIIIDATCMLKNVHSECPVHRRPACRAEVRQENDARILIAQTLPVPCNEEI